MNLYAKIKLEDNNQILTKQKEGKCFQIDNFHTVSQDYMQIKDAIYEKGENYEKILINFTYINNATYSASYDSRRSDLEG